MFFREKWRHFLLKLDAAGVKKICIGIGVFDGVHLGHVKLLDTLASHAAENGSLPVALTFSPHPRTLIAPVKPPRLLMPLAERIELLKKNGAKEVFVIDFTPEFAGMEAEEFLHILAGDSPVKIDGISVGRNWHFGRNGAGNIDVLENFCRSINIKFMPVDILQIAGENISSSNIRTAITGGLLDKACRMLGREYSISGNIVKGFSFAGDKLGHPTANLVPESEILPPDGVYGAKTFVDGSRYLAAVNIGVAPSFDFNQNHHRIEVHLLDYSGNLYGRKLEVTLLKYIRNERFFESADALKQQIIQDIQQIKSLT